MITAASAVIVALWQAGILAPVLAAFVAWLCPSPLQKQRKYTADQTAAFDLIAAAKTPEEKENAAQVLADLIARGPQ